MQYADFALWQRSWLEEAALEEGLKYWKEQLAGIPEQLELPTDRPRPAAQTFAAEVCDVALTRSRSAGLKRLSQEHQATLYMTLLAAFGVLLARYSGQDDIVVGSPIANRQEAQLEELIGFFVNSLVMRVRVKREDELRGVAGGGDGRRRWRRISIRMCRLSGWWRSYRRSAAEHDAGVPGDVCAAECAGGTAAGAGAGDRAGSRG